MFDSDRPILNSSEDRLGRTVFAKYLARCILDHQNPDSLVIGLYGGWGVGKTSVINLVVEELNIAGSNMFDEEKPIILNFSPWSYSGQRDLIFHFFRRLSATLRESPFLENKEKIINLLELYISYFTERPPPNSLQPRANFLQKLFKKRVESYGWNSGLDLTRVKAELNQQLSLQKHKIIIIIDNISRLLDAEIRQIFQIVKSMGNYAQTVYLLSCDKKIVIRALNHLQEKGGIEYLEKIVQLPFAIPPIAKTDLEYILVDRLKKIIAAAPQGAWQKEYWADLYYFYIKNFFENCRDITRYVNTLSFNYLRVKEVVNPVDFFAITAIRAFDPEVYHAIRDNKDLFTDLFDSVYHLDKSILKKDKARCDEILNLAKKIPRALLLQLMIRLFPRLRHLYQPDIPFYHSEIIARNILRICSPDTFDIYFRFSMPENDMTDAVVNTILSRAHDKKLFAEIISGLNQDQKIINFLDRLDIMSLQKIPQEYIQNIISSLMDNADYFPEGESTELSFNTAMKLHRIFYQLLQSVTYEDRYSVLKAAITDAQKSLYSLVHEISEQSREHVETEDTYVPLEYRNINPEQLHELKVLVVKKIESWASIGRLIEHPQLLPILYAWKNWSTGDDCRKFVADVTETDPGLVAFLVAMLQEPIDQIMNKLQKIPDTENYILRIEDFISVKVLEPHAKLLFEDPYFEKLREREQLALLVFLDLIHAETVKTIPKTS